MLPVFRKALYDSRKTVIWLAIGLALYMVFIMSFFPTIVDQGQEFDDLIKSYPKGMISMFCHLSKISVKKGESLARGQKIGEIGMTGRVTGPHLHWSLSLNQNRVDPMLFLPESKVSKIAPDGQ